MSAPFPFGLGIGGFAVGSGGFTVPAGFGAATGGPGGGFLAPVITLQSVFGESFSAQTVADAIKVADQQARLAAERGEGSGFPTVVEIATGPELSIVLNTARGLFEIFDRSGRKVGGGVTPEAALEAVRAGGLRPLPFSEGDAPIPGPAEGGEFGDLLKTILGALGQLRGRRPSTGLETVAIGGTVNVPVVRGSTADPAGTLRPTAAAFVPKPPPPPPRTPPRPTATQATANIARVILSLLLQRRRENFIRDAQRRQRELLARQQALLRAAAERRAMPFGQSGFVAPGSQLGPFLGGALGGLAGDAFEAILERLFRDQPGTIETQPFPRLPAFPELPPGTQVPQLPPGIPGLTGGGGVCPPLFRDRGSVLSVSPVPWFPVQAPNGKWFFFGHLGTPTFSKLKGRRKHHHHPRKR